MSYKYRGIVVFGAPGSGKTTIAKSLLQSFAKSSYVEASRLVVMPAFSMRGELPKKETAFIKIISRGGKNKSTNPPSREEARNFFTYLKNRYSPPVIAKTLEYIHQKKFRNRFLIVAGIRGYKNAVYFKKNNYLVIYLKTPDKHLTSRVSKRESFSRKAAEKEREIEERLFSTNMVEKVAHLSFNTAELRPKEIARQVLALVTAVECRQCLNSSANLSSTISPAGLCDVCEQYKKSFDKTHLKNEFKFLLTLRNPNKKKYDAMVGISGGKDSTATLYESKKLGFRPLAFSLNTGYYPKHIFQRAKHVAKTLGVDYQEINVKKYIRPVDRMSFKKTADLYEEANSEELKEKFRKWYVEGRRHYSIKCRHAIPFVRTCQLCRRIIVRAYYGEAQKYGVQVVIVGINEWAGLSQDSESKKFRFSAIRKLQPFKSKPAIYIVHLPFLLQKRIGDTKRILAELGWKIPQGEELIESNANSCLFARAAEKKSKQLLGFHPDATRLSREVTVGFITKDQARKALSKIHAYPHSVKTVLKNAGVF